MKHIRLIENVVFILSINITCFFTMYYQHRMDGSYSVADIVFDLLFAIIISWFLMVVFGKNKSVFGEGASHIQSDKCKTLLKWFAIILVKCALDAAIWFVCAVSVEWKYIGSTLLSALFWLIGYAVFVQGDVAAWENKKRLFVLCGLISAILAIGVCYDLYLIHQTHTLETKYTENSAFLLRACRNLDFFSSVKTFIVDTVILTVLVAFHMTHLSRTHRTQEKKCNILQLMVRCDIILVTAIILCVAKVSIAPQGVIAITTDEPYSHQNYEQEGQFDLTEKRKMVLDGFVAPSADRSYYYAQTVLLQKGECEPQSFQGNGKEPTYILTDKGENCGDCISFLIGERKVYLYGYYAICYYKDGKTPQIIRVDSLNKCENNAVVTELCKHLIEEGNLFVLEYAGEYLAKYEPEFIQPFVKRYCEGEFNTNEIRWLENTGYRSEYIIDLAKQISVSSIS